MAIFQGWEVSRHVLARWPQSRRKKFPELSRLFQSHKQQYNRSPPHSDQIFQWRTKDTLLVTIFPWGCTEFPEFSMFREIPEYSRFSKFVATLVGLETVLVTSLPFSRKTWVSQLPSFSDHEARNTKYKQKVYYHKVIQRYNDNLKHSDILGLLVQQLLAMKQVFCRRQPCNSSTILLYRQQTKYCLTK